MNILITGGLGHIGTHLLILGGNFIRSLTSYNWSVIVNNSKTE